jgi:hypothetical protein
MARGKYDRAAARLKRLQEGRATPADKRWLAAQNAGTANDATPRRRRGRKRGGRRSTVQHQATASTMPVAVANDAGAPMTGLRVWVFRPELVVMLPAAASADDAKRAILERSRTLLANAFESRTKGGFHEVEADSIFQPPAPPVLTLREGVNADAIMQVGTELPVGTSVQQPPAVAHDRGHNGIQPRQRKRQQSKGATITAVS